MQILFGLKSSKCVLMMSGFDRDLTMHGKQQLVVTEKMKFCFSVSFVHTSFLSQVQFFCGCHELKKVAGGKRLASAVGKTTKEVASGNAIFSTHFHAMKKPSQFMVYTLDQRRSEDRFNSSTNFFSLFVCENSVGLYL